MEFSFLGGEPSEEQQQAMREHQAQQEMVLSYKRTAWTNLLNELNVEQLIVLRMVLEDTDNPGTSAYLTGVVTGVIQFKHGKCPECGGEHGFDVKHKVVLRDESDPADHIEIKPSEPLGPDTDAGRAAMEAYDLDDLREGTPEDPGPILGYVCRNCQMRYVSIEDRMLRPPGPDGCHGCQYKSAHG